MKITDTVHYLGVNDYETDLFESLYPIPDGMSYNSYLILDEKIAVFDTVDSKFTDIWLACLEKALAGKRPDYLIIQHMEPDHSAGIARFMEQYPDTTIVSSAPSFVMMKNFFGCDYTGMRLLAKEGTKLSLGKHTLHFYAAPMVHWPEVIVTYDDYDKILFSADAFGKFGALTEDFDWTEEARRYYFGIIGRFGEQVQNLLKKLADLDLHILCPLHGPVLTETISTYLSLYDTWSSYRPEKEGVCIIYTSVYGNTKNTCELLSEKLRQRKCPDTVLLDLARADMSVCIANTFCYSKLVLATTTYNAGVFPFMKEFLMQLSEKNFQNRTVALIENGTWMPAAVKGMKAMLADCKNITFTNTEIQIKSALNNDSLSLLDTLADELCK